MEQRRTLFVRMQQLNMTEYMYAPKDDVKHRAAWRDRYTPEECGVFLCSSLLAPIRVTLRRVSESANRFC